MVVRDRAAKTFASLIMKQYEEELLRKLLDNPEYQFTINELVEDVSASYVTVREFLDDSAEYDIVTFQKKGNYRLVSYNPDNRYHDVIKSLFQADVEPLREQAEDYAQAFFNETEAEVAEKVVSVVLFGSVARGSADVNSDIDVLFLVEDEKSKELAEIWARELRDQNERFNLVVPVVESVREFRNKFEQEKRFETNVVRDGITLYGEEIDETV